MKERLLTKLIKGFAIGASMLVPGASGGTMAIVLGIYDDLIHAVSCLRENWKANGTLLLQYGISGIVGVLILSGPMLKALNLWHKPMMFLFLGAIIASIPPLYKKATLDSVKFRNIGAVAVGAGIAYLITLFPKGLLDFQGHLDFIAVLTLLVAGVAIAIALVLPGISASYLLLLLGIYDLTLQAISDFNVAYLAPIAIGVIVGTLLSAKLLEREMKRHPQFTYMLIIGFMLGSLMEVFPGIPTGMDILYCMVTFVIGLVVILWLTRPRKGQDVDATK
ncbi:MAG: DUF368 domain-containing protein [Anaerovorax sp.]